MTAEKLRGKRALVTGAGQGLGRAIALDLMSAGCDVALHYFSSKKGAEESVARAADFVRDNLASLLPRPPEVMAGEVVASA